MISAICFAKISTAQPNPRAKESTSKQEKYSPDYWKPENTHVYSASRDSLSIKYDDRKVWFTTPEDGTTLWPITDKHVGHEDKNIMYLYPQVSKDYSEIAWICVVYENDKQLKGTYESIVVFYEDGIIHWWNVK